MTVAEGKTRRTKPRRVAEGIDRTPSGKLRIRWYRGRVNGKESVGMRTLPPGTSIPEAKRERQAEIDRASRQRSGQGGDRTVDGFAARWIHDYCQHKAVTTNQHNELSLRPFLRDFGHRKPETITRAEARLWASGGIAGEHVLRHARKWVGAAENDDGEWVVPSHRNNVPAVRAMFTNLLEDEQFDLQTNPFAGLKLKQERGRSDIVVLTDAELEKLESIARRKNPIFAAMIRFAAWTGLRPSELYALRWHDVDLDAGVVRVRRQYQSKIKNPAERETAYMKTDNGNRDVPLFPPALDALATLPRPVEGDQGLVFTSVKGEQMSARVQTYYWAPIRDVFWETLPLERKCPYCVKGQEHDKHERGTVPNDFDFYELRHFYGTQLARMTAHGMTVMEISRLMGHADGGKLALERYVHQTNAEAIGSAERAYERWQRAKAADAESAAQ